MIHSFQPYVTQTLSNITLSLNSCIVFKLTKTLQNHKTCTHLSDFMNIIPKGITYLFIYLGFYIAFNTVQVISRRVVGRAEETSTYSSLGLCTVNCRPTASNYQLSHLRLCGDRTPASEVGGESFTTLPPWPLITYRASVIKC